MSKQVKEKCTHCGCIFVMGVNGTVDGCDTCTGVKRDKDGTAWGKGERVHVYAPWTTVDDPSTWVKVTRREAFKKKESLDARTN